MNLKATFKRLANRSEEELKANNKESKRIVTTYSRVLGGVLLTFKKDIVYDKNGKIRRNSNLHQIDDKGVCKRVFLEELTRVFN